MEYFFTPLTRRIGLSGCLFWLSCLLFNPALAQELSVTGKVVAPDGDGIVGVNVLEKGTSNGTITDFEGNFAFKVSSAESAIVFSFVGFKPQEVAVGTQTQFDIILEEDVETLEELVVVGYGVQKKSVVTGAIASIKSEEISQTPVATVDQALQGRTAGVNVTTNSGAPGGAISVKIRGIGSNGDSQPLYIVDGMQVGSLDFLNPNDIASMEVLKDAASAAIYGSRAANGVVLVTTKKGSSGKLQVSYDGYIGMQSPWKKVSTLNAKEYMTLHNEAAYNDGATSPIFNPSSFGSYADTDWQDEVFRNNAPIMNHAVSLSGGNEVSTFAISLGYFGQQGIVGNADNSNFDRITFRLNSEHKLSKRVTFGQNLTIAAKSSAGISEQNDFGGILNSTFLHDPITPAVIQDAETAAIYAGLPYNPVMNSNGQYYGISDQGLREVANPMAMLENSHNAHNDRNIIGNAYLTVDLLPGLKFKTDLGLDLYNSFSRGYNPMQYMNVVNMNRNSSAWQEMNDNVGFQWENVLSYQKTINGHDFSAILGNTIQEYTGKGTWGSRNDISPDGWYYGWLENGANDDTQKSNGWFWRNRLASFFSRVNYSYKDKYMVQATIRRDGSSRFGDNNKFGAFPSVSGGWTISNEDFFAPVAGLNFLKLRASWGQVGNQSIGDFGYLSLANRANGYPVNGNIINGIAINRMANPDLKWETSEQANVGLDFGFLEDKIQMTAEYYSKTTRDLLGVRPMPDYLGMESPLFNMGTVQNQGVEFNLTYAKKTGDFTYDITGNFSYNKNRVLEVANQNGYIDGDAPHVHTGNMRMAEGYALPFFYGYKTAGIFQNQEQIDNHVNAEGKQIQPDAKPGDIIFVDMNGDGVITEEDRTNIGNPVPDWNFGLTFNANYKNFDFSIFFQGAAGFDIANIMRRGDLDMQNYGGATLGRWTGEGSTNSYPRMTHEDQNRNYTRLNDMVHLERGDYLRVKNIQLGYTLPTEISEKAGLSRARIYASVQNAFTFTGYSGYDPELASFDIFNYGMDRGGYPQSRIIMMGVNLNF
ncbi:TonB-dependent receptor [Persicobacter diffluens]|uniref:SusC/RagA family TonB-linked outer membrane protein n=1 Tax=Persicobacter diffluens TaxID=981 RepID=A0AAN5APR2_9BACT|nr:SusC/RagA family TonB-linked outer membrane protein [Persicobacter diffluens]